MNLHLMWQGIAEAALNYIVVQTISNNNSQKTISDVKTDLRTTKEDIMAELKDSRENILTQIELSTKAEIDVLKSNIHEVKEMKGKDLN